MLLDKTSESGRIMSGVMTGLGGSVQTGVAAARVMAQDWSALPQLIMGIFNVINGVGIVWETDAERLERLTKEAENLTNESKKAKAEYNTAYGNMVLINHGGGVSTLYAHGSEILVEVGQEVKRGDPVLKVGSTGYSTGPHAHFEVRINGQYVNPIPYITTTEEN